MITAFLGHYGSGKTQIALNYALHLRKSHDNVVLADLDIVNPYFRTSDAADMLLGIRLIASAYANSNLDIPSMPPDAQAVFDGSAQAVLDVGGDDRGALALGRYASKLKDASLWMVINKYRPQTSEPHGVLEILREIEAAAHIKINGLVNNSNLGSETTADDVTRSEPYANAVSDLCGLPVVMTTVWDKLHMDGHFPVKIFPKNAWRL